MSRAISVQRGTSSMFKTKTLHFYLGWIGANSLAEVIGLGATFAIGYTIAYNPSSVPCSAVFNSK